MACQIGRVTGIQSPSTIRQDGEVLRLGGEFVVDPAAGVALAQQLMGYPNQDEQVVPFIYDATAVGGLLDGLYVVEGTDIDWTKLAAGLFSWSATLAAIPGKQAAILQVLCRGALRSNAHSITTAANPWVAIPGAAVALDFAHGDDGSALTETGAVTYFIDSSGSGLYDSYVSYSVPVADFYDAACLLQYTTDSGSTWKTVVGRQILNDADGWRASNGRVRVSIVTGDPRVEWWDSGSGLWEATDFEIFYDGSGAWTPNTVTVLRNSPECVAVRVHLTHSTGRGTYWDLTVRRGATWVEGFASAIDSDFWGLWRSASENGANITAGVEAAAANAAGNKFVMLTTVAKTNDISGVSGFDLNADATSMRFAFSPVNVGVDGADATSAHYFAAMRHRQRAVAR